MANTNPSPATGWKPGESGNPSGYSRGRRLTDSIFKALEDGGKWEEFARVGLNAALAGDFQYWREILNRIDGPIPPAVDAGTEQAPTLTPGTAARVLEALLAGDTEQGPTDTGPPSARGDSSEADSDGPC